MKTVEDLKADNERIRSQYGKGEVINRNDKSMIEMNRQCISAITFGISEENAMEQLIRLEKKISLISSKFDEWMKNTPGIGNIKNKKSYYENMNNMSTMRAQVKFLKYLLA